MRRRPRRRPARARAWSGVRRRRCASTASTWATLPARAPRLRGREPRRRPTVITFDHHPDEVLTGQAPPLLLDPDERLERLGRGRCRGHRRPALRPGAAADALRRLRRADPDRVALTGFLMTPDAAFGFERRGTPATLAELGRARRIRCRRRPAVRRSTAGRSAARDPSAIAAGHLAARPLLGRPVTLTGSPADRRRRRARFRLPLALPPTAVRRRSTVGRASCGSLRRRLSASLDRVTVVLERPERRSAAEDLRAESGSFAPAPGGSSAGRSSPRPVPVL